MATWPVEVGDQRLHPVEGLHGLVVEDLPVGFQCERDCLEAVVERSQLAEVGPSWPVDPAIVVVEQNSLTDHRLSVQLATVAALRVANWGTAT